jgi:hypothetical protein
MTGSESKSLRTRVAEVVLACYAVLLYCGSSAQALELEVTIPNELLQALLLQSFPLTVVLGTQTYTLSQPQLEYFSEDRIGLIGRFSARSNPQEQGEFAASSKLGFEPSTRHLKLNQTRIEWIKPTDRKSPLNPQMQSLPDSLEFLPPSNPLTDSLLQTLRRVFVRNESLVTVVSYDW